MGYVLFIFIFIGFFVALYFVNQMKIRMMEKKYPPTGEFVNVEGIRLHYISKGSGKPIVFLHGGVLCANDFEQVIERIASNGYRGIAFDRPGYGYSERPKDEQVTPETQARYLHKALKALKVENPVIVAHSWSGVLALTYALHYPNDVFGLITLGGGMYREGYPAEKGDPISKLVTTPILGRVLMNTMLAVLGPMLANRILIETFKPEAVPEGYRQATYFYWLRPTQFKANREDVLAFVPAVERIKDQYKKIKLPMIIVVGEQDPFETKEHSYCLHKEVPHSQLIVLQDVAHMIPQNHPDAVVQAIETLMDCKVEN